MGFFVPVAQAYSLGEFGQDLFSTGDKGMSFTEYSGTLGQLDDKNYDKSLVSSTDLKEYIITIVDYALGFLGLIAVIIVIYGGVLYVTAAGEDEKVGKAKKAIGYAAVGLLIVMGSFAFVNTIIKGAGGEGESGTGMGATAFTSTNGFNASAEQVKAYAVEILNGFSFLAEVTEDLKNIKNDLGKDSLLPLNLPTKGEIITFLNSVKEKLNNISSKLQQFSVAEANINNLLRDLDKDIDIISGLSNYRYMNKSTIKYCDIDKERGFWEGALGASDKKICDDADGNYTDYYIQGLLPAWDKIYKKFNAASTPANPSPIDAILGPVAASYATDLKRIFSELDSVYANFKNIQAIGQGKSNAAYIAMMNTLGYGYTVGTTGTVTKSNTGLLNSVEAWGITSANIDTAGGFLIYGLKQQSILYEELKKLQFVQARLTADTIEGSAPLTVTFNALSTVDPAGGSVQSDHIIWDLAGTQTVDSLTAINGASQPSTIKNSASLINRMLIPSNGAVDCTFSVGSNETSTGEKKTEADYIGATSKRCVFKKPGTYTAAVKIDSNDPTKYAPGISVLTIKVSPPTTKIELTVQATGENEPHAVMHYIDDLLVVDEDAVQVTSHDAESGIEFSAKGTLDVKDDGCKWNFGDGKSTEFQSCGGEPELHEYKKPGKYQITLEVLSIIPNVMDKKIFTLEISSVAARLKANPAEGSFINDTVIFDASASKSDLGKITNYIWNIKLSQNQDIKEKIRNEIDELYRDTIEGANLKTLTQAFKYAAKYDISVKVEDDAQNKAEATIKDYLVQSQPPVAQFDFKNTDKTQPGTFTFDGSKSFDPDGGKNFTYAWSITPGAQGADWEIIQKTDSSQTGKKPVIYFKKVGDYEVTLRVTDETSFKEYSEITKTIKIDNILDVAWNPEQQVTATLDENGQAEVEFNIDSENGETYEINFGDGETASGNLEDDEIKHAYNQTGKFTVKATVYDEEDNENTIERRIFISGGDQPIAKARVFVNGDEIQDLTIPIPVSKKDVVTFDAGDSRNAEGDTANLKYSWNFGDEKNSSKIKSTHTYKELSPTDPGYFKAILTVYDSEDPEKIATDEALIEVKNMPPIFSSIQGVPQPVNSTLITPVSVQMKVFGEEDPDGEIVKYKWWYFDVKSPEQQFGIQITNTPTSKLTIGTRGKEGEEITYGFGLEITDSDGLTYSNEDEIDTGQAAKMEVTNGANALPVAKFTVSSTAIFTGDKVTFSSSSTDPDGQIKDYIWDFDGDGFFNDEPASEASMEHTYTTMNKTGIDVRLKVVDDKGGESISGPIKIYIDSLAEPPTAGFTFESIPGSEGMKIKFTNTSTTDEKAGAELLSTQWDFDTDSDLANADSNGDGKKDNDVDSQAKNPERLFTEKETYKVKLTVTDNQGNKDEVINTVKVPMANPPLAAFTYTFNESQAEFKNTSNADIKSGSIITKYVWDFDLNIDSDGDGKKDNDNDSQLKDPAHTYQQAGIYKVKLTIIDNQGGSDDVINDVTYSPVAVSGGGQTPTGGGLIPGGGANSGLIAAMTVDPLPAADGFVYLSGTSGTVKFDFSKSQGAIQYYIIDKNIYFDTDGNGNKTDDQDFKTPLSGTWTTNFDKSWGKTVAKMTVLDIYGNESSVTQEIKFK